MSEIHHKPQWLAAVDQLYDAVGREQGLAQALDAFRPLFDAQAVSFFTAPDLLHPHSSHTGAAGMNDQMLLEYHAHFSPHDEWVNAAVKRSDFATGAVYRGTELVEPLRLQQSYFGKTFLARHGVVDVLAAVVETACADGSMSWVSFHRHRGQPAFSESDARTMSALAPHMRQVLRLHRRLAPQIAVGATLREVVQRMETPLIFVGTDGRIVDRNAAAQVALQGTPCWLRDRTGRLLVSENGRWQDVSTWLPNLRNGASVVVDLVNEENHCATLEVFPIAAAFADHVASHPAAAICCLKPGARDRMHALRRTFGLSPAEARVAVKLADGRTPSEIAAAMQVSLSTVRTQIAAVRGKLGVRRQVQIVAAVLSL